MFKAEPSRLCPNGNFHLALQPSVATLVATHHLVSQLNGQMHCKPTANQMSAASNWDVTQNPTAIHTIISMCQLQSVLNTVHTQKNQRQTETNLAWSSCFFMSQSTQHTGFLFLAPSTKALRALGRHELGLGLHLHILVIDVSSASEFVARFISNNVDVSRELVAKKLCSFIQAHVF